MRVVGCLQRRWEVRRALFRPLPAQEQHKVGVDISAWSRKRFLKRFRDLCRLQR